MIYQKKGQIIPDLMILMISSSETIIRQGQIKHFFYFYFLNTYPLIIIVIALKFALCVPRVLLEGSVSQIFHLGLPSYFMKKNR